MENLTQNTENQTLTLHGGDVTLTSENNVNVKNLLTDLIFKTFENTTDEIIKDLREIEIHEGGFISLRFNGIRLQEIEIFGDNGMKTIQRKDFKNKWGQKCELMGLLIKNNL